MAINVGSGIASQIVAVDETTYGVVPASWANARSYEFKNESLVLGKTAVQGQGLHAGGLYDRGRRRVVTNYDVKGGINLDLQTRNLAFWLRHMLGSFGQTLATPTQVGSTGVYRSVHMGPGGSQTTGGLLGHSFSLQKGIPAIDGTVEPFTYVGCKVVDWAMKAATGALVDFTLNIDGRNELGGAGNGDPLNASVPALQTFGLPSTGRGTEIFSFRQASVWTGGVPTIVASDSLTPPSVPATGVPATNTFDVEVLVTVTGGTLTAILVNGSQVATVAGTYAVPAGGTIAWTGSVAPTWTWKDATAPATGVGEIQLVGATLAGNIKDIEIKHAVSLDQARYFLGSSGFKGEQIENGFRKISGQFTVEWLSSESYYNAYAQDTTTSLQLTLTGGQVGTDAENYLLDVIIPMVKFDGESPKAGGPAVVVQTVPFSGLDDETSVPIQIIYQSEDTAV